MLKHNNKYDTHFFKRIDPGGGGFCVSFNYFYFAKKAKISAEVNNAPENSYLISNMFSIVVNGRF